MLLVTGCSVEKGRQVPPLLADNKIAPSFALPDVRERMIYLARQEWELFGQPEINYEVDPPTVSFPENGTISHETQPPFLSRVLMYWYTATHLAIIGYEGELRPWSGAFIIWLARNAGVPEQDLPSTVLHWDYIKHTIKAGANNRFISRKINAYAPKPGDLVCAPRGEAFINSMHTFRDLRRGAYHCDLVVDKRPGEIDVIGGNVLDRVALAHLKLDEAGRLQPSKARPWMLVIEQR